IPLRDHGLPPDTATVRARHGSAEVVSKRAQRTSVRRRARNDNPSPPDRTAGMGSRTSGGTAETSQPGVMFRQVLNVMLAAAAGGVIFLAFRWLWRQSSVIGSIVTV